MVWLTVRIVLQLMSPGWVGGSTENGVN